jgi:hypothetical protein
MKTISCLFAILMVSSGLVPPSAGEEPGSSASVKGAAATLKDLKAKAASAESTMNSRKRSMASADSECARIARLMGQNKAQFDERHSNLVRECTEHNARESSIRDDDAAAVNAYNREKEYLERKQKIYNSDLQSAIRQEEAMFKKARDTWISAQKEFQSAAVKHAKLIEQQNLALLDFEAKVKEERVQEEAKEAKREADTARALAASRQTIESYTSAVDTGPPKPRRDVIIPGSHRGQGDGFLGTRKADTRRRFGDPNDLENVSEQARQGFDTPGRLMATPTNPKLSTPKGVEVLPVSIPKGLKDDPQIVKYQTEWKAAQTEVVSAEKELEKIRVLRSKPLANKNDLDMKEVEARTALDMAQNKKNHGEVMVKETIRKFTEKKLD